MEGGVRLWGLLQCADMLDAGMGAAWRLAASSDTHAYWPLITRQGERSVRMLLHVDMCSMAVPLEV